MAQTLSICTASQTIAAGRPQASDHSVQYQVQLPALLRELEECYYIREQASLMIDPKQQSFDVEAFLASAGLGRRITQLRAHEVFFSQGGEADSTFYLQKGRAKLTVVSAAGKEATLAFLTAGDFIGEESMPKWWDAAWQQPRPSALVPRSK